jgi:hypothetical protein
MTHTTKGSLNIKYLNIYLLSRFYEEGFQLISLKFSRSVVAHRYKTCLRFLTSTQWHRTTNFRLQTTGRCGSNHSVLLAKNLSTSYRKNRRYPILSYHPVLSYLPCMLRRSQVRYKHGKVCVLRPSFYALNSCFNWFDLGSSCTFVASEYVYAPCPNSLSVLLRHTTVSFF